MSGFAKPAVLADGADLRGFKCGVNVVDSWAHRHAPKAHRQGTAVVYVSYRDGVPAGFYTLSSHSVRRFGVGGGWLKRNTPSRFPPCCWECWASTSGSKAQGSE